MPALSPKGRLWLVLSLSYRRHTFETITNAYMRITCILDIPLQRIHFRFGINTGKTNSTRTAPNHLPTSNISTVPTASRTTTTRHNIHSPCPRPRPRPSQAPPTTPGPPGPRGAVPASDSAAAVHPPALRHRPLPGPTISRGIDFNRGAAPLRRPRRRPGGAVRRHEAFIFHRRGRGPPDQLPRDARGSATRARRTTTTTRATDIVVIRRSRG